MAKQDLNTKTEQELTLFVQGDADWLRYTLSHNALGFYPTNDMRNDPGHDYYEENVRKNLLPTMLERLDRNDLEAIYRMAEALAIYPVWEGFWPEAAEYQRERLEFLVKSGQVPKRVLKIYNERYPEAAK